MNIPVQFDFNQVCSSGEIDFYSFSNRVRCKQKMFCAGGHLTLLIDQYIKLTRLGGHLTLLINQYKVNQTWWSSYITDRPI